MSGDRDGDHSEIYWGSVPDELLGDEDCHWGDMSFLANEPTEKCESGRHDGEIATRSTDDCSALATIDAMRISRIVMVDNVPATQKRTIQQLDTPRKRQPLRAVGATLHLKSGADFTFRRDVQTQLWEDQTRHIWPMSLSVQVQWRNGNVIDLKCNEGAWEGTDAQRKRVSLDRQAISCLIKDENLL
ncbi:hypothetical protein HRG_012276 [Hirsutella rhossiliensis]